MTQEQYTQKQKCLLIAIKRARLQGKSFVVTSPLKDLVIFFRESLFLTFLHEII